MNRLGRFEAPRTSPLEVDDAVNRILEAVKPLEIRRVPLYESIGFILAEEITATLDIPLFNRAMMDGFAVRSEDIREAHNGMPVRLNVVGELKAGEAPQRAIGPGEAMRIMTGSMIPEGADAVCPFEATKEQFRQGVKAAEVLRPFGQGDNIAFQGEDIPKGSVVLQPGVKIGAAEAAVLASFGKAEISVYRKPVIGILTSGTELTAVGEPLSPGKIYDSNSSMLAALIWEAGGIPKPILPVADHVESIAGAIQSTLGEVDALVTTGGVSVGDYDFMEAVYEKLGAKTRFWRVLIRPGSPLRFAMRGDFPIFGLSGNVAACFVNAQLFMLPALRRMAGSRQPFLPAAQAVLVNGLDLKPIKPTRFLRASAYLERGELKVQVAQGQSSGMLGSFVGSNCFIRLNGGETLRANSRVSLLLFDRLQTL